MNEYSSVPIKLCLQMLEFIISLHFICYRIIFFSLYAPIKTEPKNRPGVKTVSEDHGVQKGIGTFFKCE